MHVSARNGKISTGTVQLPLIRVSALNNHNLERTRVVVEWRLEPCRELRKISIRSLALVAPDCGGHDAPGPPLHRFPLETFGSHNDRLFLLLFFIQTFHFP